jgi:hypothetical protein
MLLNKTVWLLKKKMMLLTLLFCSDLHDQNKILKTFYKKIGNNFVPIFHDFVRQVRPFPFFIFDFQNVNILNKNFNLLTFIQFGSL